MAKPKPKDQHSLPTQSPSLDASDHNATTQHRWIENIVRPRCLVALLLGISVVLSSVFWILPFHRHRKGSGGADSMRIDGVNVVASFGIQRSVSELQTNNQKLRYDISSEIGISNSLVVILSVEPISRPNWTIVVFGVVPDPTNSTIPSNGLNILRSYFASLFVGQSTLHLTASSFGNSSFFQVLEFPGGITIIPPQNAFMLQDVQFFLNFTLNFSIYQMQDKIGELREQMATGFHLSSSENLYFTLTNLVGSTVASPTIVQTGMVPVVGPGSKSRIKELGQAIAGSPRNLGLNHSVFGRVKQIHLSSFLQHSLNGGDNGSVSWSPSPAPQQYPGYQQPQNPGNRPTPPAPNNSSYAASPSGCQFGFP